MGGTDGTTVPLRYFLSQYQYRGGNGTRAIFFSIFNHIIIHYYYALTKDFPKISGIETKLEARARNARINRKWHIINLKVFWDVYNIALII